MGEEEGEDACGEQDQPSPSAGAFRDILGSKNEQPGAQNVSHVLFCFIAVSHHRREKREESRSEPSNFWTVQASGDEKENGQTNNATKERIPA
jgi:hypothetical protein